VPAVAATAARLGLAAGSLVPKPAPGGELRPPAADALVALRGQLARLEAEAAAATRRAEAAEQRAAAFASRLDALDGALADLRASRAVLPRPEGLDASLAELSSRLDALAAASASLGPIASRLDALEASLRSPRAAGEPPAAPGLDPSGMAALEERVQKLERLGAELGAAQQELAEHRRLFESRRARIESLESRLGRAENDPRLAELRRAVEALDLRARSSESPSDGVGALASRLDALEARVAAAGSTPPRKGGRRAAAGLASLKGLGPKFRAQLEAQGVTELGQIAAWGSEDLARLSSLLGVPKKKLEAWVEAAKAAR
jgi:hypothetical protein